MNNKSLEISKKSSKSKTIIIEDEILELPTKSFSVVTLQAFYEQSLEKQRKSKKEIPDEILYESLTKYVQKYYFEIEKGNYLFFNFINESFQLREKKDFMNEVICKCDKKLYNILFEKNYKIYSIVSKIDKPRLYKENDQYYINECKGFLHLNTHKNYIEYSDKTKEKLQIMLDYIKEISCGGDEKFYQVYLKYLSQVCRGIRTEVIIYKKTMQGTGKSTESDFMMEYVLGNDVSICSGTDPLLTSNNKSLLGKVYVVFEELPTFSQAQWGAVSSKCKQIATNPKLSYCEKYEKAFIAENFSNLVINTNCDSIKDSYGRRIIIMPVNNSKMEDYDYFGKIRNNCFNLKVGECFYAYMMSIDVSNFYAQKEFPETEAKRIAISELLVSHMKFLKFNYFLQSKSINNVITSELYKEYTYFSSSNQIKYPLTKNNFYKALKEDLKIEAIKKTNSYVYNVTLEQLEDLAKRFKWVCKYDEFLDEKKDVKPTKKETIYESDDSDDEYDI